ncbi:MAG TPA: C25 family cysteine peptidase [Verrucomicrobiae bacterium]|nr:C25 family cysteine peptidase [Verrucomicrobiae bacterium]
MKARRALAGTSVGVWVLLVLFVFISIAPAADSGQWIVVTPPAFRNALVPLIERRQAQGFKVVVLDTTDIFSPQQLQQGDGTPLLARLKALCQPGRTPAYVLLAGICITTAQVNAERIVPSLRGTVERMKGQPTDSGYGLPGPDGMPAISVGRFPARTADELAGMVRKTIAFEQAASPAPWRNRLLLLLGNPGGGPFAEMFVAQELQTDLASLYPGWEMRTLFNASSSPFYLPRPHDHDTALRYLQEGQLFSIFLGHSYAGGMGLDGKFLLRPEWEDMNIPQGAGPFFTCGCFACQPNENDPGYGLAAMRNPSGPVAVIGASGLTYSATGQLAVEGLLGSLERPPFPERLGQYWLAVQAGLARGKMDPGTFALMDMADGSLGKTPLPVQRLEHLEMWLLLGDPALRLPVILDDITLSADGPVKPGSNLKVSGVLPDRLSNAAVHVTLERPLNSTSSALEPVPPNSPENRRARERILIANHHRANSYVLTEADAVAVGKTFSVSLAVPAALPWTNLTLKASATTSNESGLGVLVLRKP